VKTATLGDPHILKKPYTRFMVHYMDLNRLVGVLGEESIPYFAMERKLEMKSWIVHIPDDYRRVFDEMIIETGLNVSTMHEVLWYQDRDEEAAEQGLRSRRAQRALVFVVIVIGLLLLAALMVEIIS
jgi:hypothetical protein